MYVALFLLGLIAHLISTLSGGGGSLIVVSAISMLLGPENAPPVANTSSLLGQPGRLLLLWKHIDWDVVRHYVPFAIMGVVMGAWTFSKIRTKWLGLLMGMFLISTVLQYDFGDRERSFPMKLEWFAPVGFFNEFLNTVFGATGPTSNPFYLNYGLQKERFIATETFNSFAAGIFQVLNYWYFGNLESSAIPASVAVGSGGFVGNMIGSYLLGSISPVLFRRLAIAAMFASGSYMLWRGR